MKEYQNIFTPQHFSCEVENASIRNNMTIDYVFGHRDILEEFIMKNQEFESHYTRLTEFSQTALLEQARKAANKSVLMTIIMLTGRCNANCGICCTDRKNKLIELNLAEIKSIMYQTKALGSRTLYIPGEGEPFLDKAFWKILDYAKLLSMEVIVFTNGLILSNDKLAFKEWGVTSEDIVKALKEYPIYIYHKLWSSDPDLVTEMMGVTADAYKFVAFDFGESTINIPKGLQLLIEHLPNYRVGIETVVTNRNLEEIVRNFIPFVHHTRIKSYIEPILHSGRYLGRFEFDLKPEQQRTIDPWLSRKKRCRRLGYKIMVHNSGHLSFGITVDLAKLFPLDEIEHLNIRNNKGNVKNIYNMVHSEELLVRNRYRINECVCEKVNLDLSQRGYCNLLTEV